jgi:hypothetical protein
MKYMKHYFTLVAVLWVSLCAAQKLKMTETEIPLSKDAKKKGMYVTTRLKDGQLQTFVTYDLKKGELGFDAITMDMTGKVVSSSVEPANATTTKKYDVFLPEPNTVENPAKGKSAIRLVSASGALGAMKIEKGTFEPVYATEVDFGGSVTTYTKILRGYKFVEGKSVNSDTKINIMASHVDPKKAIEKDYTIVENAFKIGTVGFFMENTDISFIGKDARFDKTSPYAQNVLASGKYLGKTQAFADLNQIVLDYNVNFVTSGWDGKGNRSVLVSTLNAPTSIAEHKKWQAEGVPYMTYITFDLDGKVKENVTFKSKSVRGNFGVYGIDDASFVFGSINSEHNGYYRSDIGKATDFQVVKIVNGEVVKQNAVSYESLADKILAPGGDKAKLKFKDITFTAYEPMGDGGFLAFANAGTEDFIFQISTDAEVQAVYVIGRVPGKEFFELGPQVAKSGSNIFIFFREQSVAITQGVSKTFSRSSSSYMKNVSFNRVDELMTYGRVVKINPAAKTCSEPVDFSEDVVLGESPMFINDAGALLMPARDSKRNLKLVVIQ